MQRAKELALPRAKEALGKCLPLHAGICTGDNRSTSGKHDGRRFVIVKSYGPMVV
jgi:hypothetical protein